MDIVKYLVKIGADFKISDNDCRTPLYWAALKKQWNVVKYLVEQEADIKTADKKVVRTSIEI